MLKPANVSYLQPEAGSILPILIACRNIFATSLLPLLYLFSTGTLFFDVVHYTIHRCNKSSHPFLKWLARLHHFHHLYYNRHLKFDEKYLWNNILMALPLELGLQIIGTFVGFILAVAVIPKSLTWATRGHLWLTIGFQLLKTVCVALMEGRDTNHVVYNTVPKDHNWIFVGPEFHALHHAFPDRYMGSFVKIFDWIAGTSYSFRNQRFAIVTGGGALGSAIAQELQKDGASCIRRLKFGKDWNYSSFEKIIPILCESDVLILAHSIKDHHAMRSNYHAAVHLVCAFLSHRKPNSNSVTLPEVWYVGSGSGLHPRWGNSVLKRYSNSDPCCLLHKNSLFNDPLIIDRHIVPLSLKSPTGADVMSEVQIAKMTMWWIRRGVRYTPTIVHLNPFKFIRQKMSTLAGY